MKKMLLSTKLMILILVYTIPVIILIHCFNWYEIYFSLLFLPVFFIGLAALYCDRWEMKWKERIKERERLEGLKETSIINLNRSKEEMVKHYKSIQTKTYSELTNTIKELEEAKPNKFIEIMARIFRHSI